MTPTAEATASIDAVLDGLHWSMLDIAECTLLAGAVHREAGTAIRFFYVVAGVVRLVHAGEARTIRDGDFVLLPHGGPATFHADAHAQLVSGTLRLDLDGPIGPSVMPAMLVSCDFRTHEPVFASLLESLHREVECDRPGADSVVRRAADLVASAALRVWFERGCGDPRTWLASLRNPNLGRAIEAIHREPGRHWTVESLARLARVSRSQFTEQFKESVGRTPARYLTSIRMERAERLLRAGASVTEIAYSLGYDSDEGFSRAFRRHAGAPPSLWRVGEQAGAAAGAA